MKAKIILRKGRINSNGESPIYLKVTQHGKAKYFSLDLWVKEKSFNSKTNRVKANSNDLQYMDKNKKLAYFDNKAKSIIDESIYKNESLSFDEFAMKFKNDLYNTNNFYDYVLYKLKQKLDNNEIAVITYNTNYRHVTKLQRFKPVLLFGQINSGFIESYKKYMINELNNKPQTWSRSISNIKTFCTWAVNDKVITKNPVGKVHRYNEVGQKDFLNTNEVEILQNLYDSGQLTTPEKNVLRYFLFCCYTGLRFSDIKTFTFEHINTEIWNGETHRILNKIQQKVKNPVEVPLIKQAVALLPDMVSKYQSVFRVYTNKHTNTLLKDIARRARIKKSLSFHVARYTFGSIGLENGIPIEYISKMLGHSTISITNKIYTKVNAEMKYKELMKLENH